MDGLIVFARSADGSSSVAAAIVIAALVVIGGYFISLFLHPQTSCRACGGRGRNHGAIYRYSIGSCGRCGGSGRKERFGRRLLRSSNH